MAVFPLKSSIEAGLLHGCRTASERSQAEARVLIPFWHHHLAPTPT